MRALLNFATLLLRCILAFLRSRREQAIVELALRQQLAFYAQNRPQPQLLPLDRTFWVVLSRLWPRWKDNLVLVRPETVVRWSATFIIGITGAKPLDLWILCPRSGQPKAPMNIENKQVCQVRFLGA